MNDFKYRPDIDGLRAIAVGLVLLFHANLEFAGGYIGVDVFFVISGFLITGLILKRQSEGRFRLTDFWVRRIRRILPASILVTAVTLVTAAFLFMPDDYENLGESVIFQQLMVSNIYFWQSFGYFTSSVEQQPLLHTWSLAVEEQFYLIYPLILVGLGRFSRKTQWRVLLVLFFSSLVGSEWMVHTHPNAAFYLLPARAWELIFGGLICYLPSPRGLGQSLLNKVSLVSLLTIIVCGMAYGVDTPFPGLFAALPCIATGAIIYLNQNELTPTGIFLSSKYLVRVGLLSYSLYLWHWPVLVCLRYRFDGELSTFAALLALGLSGFLAYLSWRYVETPFRKGIYLTSKRNLFAAAACIPAILLICGMMIEERDGFPERLPPQAQHYFEYRNSNRATVSVVPEKLYRGDIPEFGDLDSPIKILVSGDSHAMSLMPAIESACVDLGIKGYRTTHSSSPPLLDFYLPYSHKRRFGLAERSLEYNRAILAFAIENEISLVIMSAYWDAYARKDDFKVGLEKTMQAFEDAGIAVALIEDVAFQRTDIPVALAHAAWQGKEVNLGVTAEAHARKTKSTREAFSQLNFDNVRIYDPAPYLTDETGFWPAQVDGVPNYRDRHHLSLEGSMKLTELMRKALLDGIPRTALIGDHPLQ